MVAADFIDLTSSKSESFVSFLVNGCLQIKAGGKTTADHHLRYGAST